MKEIGTHYPISGMNNISTLYRCNICNHTYFNIDDAITCSNSTKELQVKEGDIVIYGFGYAWYNGDTNWVINHSRFNFRRDKDKDGLYNGLNKSDRRCINGNGNCFDWCCTIGFYYVVKEILPNQHKYEIILETKAMNNNGHNQKHVNSDEHYLLSIIL